MKSYQMGGGLVEALMSLVVLSVGILGLIGMQATLIQDSSESRVRMQAGFFATSVLGMAAANPENVGCFIVNSAQSAACVSPDAQTQASGWLDQVMSVLPGAASVPPQVNYDITTGGQVAQSNFATGELPWTGKSLAQSLSTRPVIVVLPNGQINSLVRSADGAIMSNRLPLSWNRNVKKISWKEIVR